MRSAGLHRGFACAWGATLLLIFTIAIVGRTLQHWVESIASLQAAAYLILGTIGLTVGGWLARHARRVPPARAAVATAVAIGIVAWGLTFDRPEETMHLLLFGLLGALAVPAFGLPAAIPLALVCAGADELLQLYLPDRVGDWPDVGTNTLAALAGCVLGWAQLGVRDRNGDRQ